MLASLIICSQNGDAWDGPAASRLFREFPSVAMSQGALEHASVRIDADAWRAPSFDLWAFDRRLDAVSGRPFALGLTGAGDEIGEVAGEVLTRAQRLVARRNRHSQGARFDRILAKHRSLYDLSKPLVLADYDHALDVWQWTLRRHPDACFAVQVAALFHDIERLDSEADVRIEASARDYQQFKDAHAAIGARITLRHLREMELEPAVEARIVELVAHHERGDSDEERLLLEAADALSFFSLNSSGFLDYYGPAHTRKKVLYSLRRLGNDARAELRHMRIRPEILAMVEHCQFEVCS